MRIFLLILILTLFTSSSGKAQDEDGDKPLWKLPPNYNKKIFGEDSSECDYLGFVLSHKRKTSVSAIPENIPVPFDEYFRPIKECMKAKGYIPYQAEQATKANSSAEKPKLSDVAYCFGVEKYVLNSWMEELQKEQNFREQSDDIIIIKKEVAILDTLLAYQNNLNNQNNLKSENPEWNSFPQAILEETKKGYKERTDIGELIKIGADKYYSCANTCLKAHPIAYVTGINETLKQARKDEEKQEFCVDYECKQFLTDERRRLMECSAIEKQLSY